MAHRDIAAIQNELAAANGAVATLQIELSAAQLAKFLKDNGVPDGAKPIFYSEKTKKKVLVDRCDSFWASGFVVNKGGELSVQRRNLYSQDKYVYQPE